MADVEHSGTLDKNAGDTEIQFERQGALTLLIRLSGRWTVRSMPPAVEALQTQLDSFEDIRTVAFDAAGIADWDSSLLTLLMDLHAHCTGKSIAVETDGLPEGVARLIALATAVPERTGAHRLTDRRDHTFEIPVIMKVERDSFRAIDTDNEIKDRKRYMQDLVQSGLRAQLQLQSLVTGQLMVNLDFFPDTPIRIVADRRIAAERGLTEIPTIQTPLQKIEQTLEALPIKEIAENINKSLAAIEKIMTSGQLGDSLEGLNQAAADIRRLVNRVDEKVDPLTDEINRTLKGTRDLIEDLTEEVKPLAVSLRQTSDAAGRLIANVDRQVEPLAGRIGESIEAAYATLRQAEQTLATVSGTIDEGTPFRVQVETTFGKLGQAANSIQALADYLKRNPDALIRGKSTSGGF